MKKGTHSSQCLSYARFFRINTSSFMYNIRYSLLVLFATTIFFAIPFTTFQYLDLQYQTQHVQELQYTVRDEPMMTEYAYLPTPWNIPMRASTTAFLIIPALTAIFVSFRSLTTSQGTIRSRFINSLLVASSFTPFFYLCNLPWGFFYWDGWEWPVSGLLVLFYGFLVIICAGVVNGFTLRKAHRRASS